MTSSPAPSPGQRRGEAVILLTELKMIVRHLDLIAEIRRHGAQPVLLFSFAADSTRLAALSADPRHPLSGVTELRRVADSSAGSVLAELEQMVRRYDIVGVMSVGELFVEAAGAVADLLGLPGAGWRAAHTSRNKVLQRMLLPELAPDWRAVTPIARDPAVAEGLDYPVVVKPNGRMSSSGVRQVDRPGDLAAVLDSYPPGELVLVEHRVTGPEYSVESFVREGKILWTGLTAKRTTEAGGRFFAEVSHTSPPEGLADTDRDALLDANARVLGGLAFGTGIAHMELRLTTAGPVLMEAAVRVPGGGISVLWQLATGVSMERTMVELALGHEPDVPEPRRRARLVYLDHPHGVLRDVHSPAAPVSWTSRDDRWPRFAPSAPQDPAAGHAVLVVRLPGDELGALRDSNGRAVCVVADAPLDTPIDPVSRELAASVTIVTDPAGPPGSVREPA